MLHRGFLPFFLHGLVEYAAGVFLVVAPFVFGYDDGLATGASIVLGIAILGVAAATDSPAGLNRTIPVKAHVALDLVVVALLVASPFLLGFSDEDTPTAVFIALGVAHLLITISTRFLRSAEDADEHPAGDHEQGSAEQAYADELVPSQEQRREPDTP
ncbi:MAG: hypothetical protein H0T13_04080 [Actinobacteria bacterium]|nr:hypothetical protein [Actinomycetota bacterium]